MEIGLGEIGCEDENLRKDLEGQEMIGWKAFCQGYHHIEWA